MKINIRLKLITITVNNTVMNRLLVQDRFPRCYEMSKMKRKVCFKYSKDQQIKILVNDLQNLFWS